MSRRAGMVVAGVAVTVGSLIGLPRAAHAGQLPYAKTTMTFNVVVGPHDDQHCSIIGDLYRPNAATQTTPAPAILTTNGFGGSKDDQAKDADGYARHGYVVLSYSGLGFGGSTCNIELDDRDWDGKAASQLVDFLGRQPFVLHDGPGDPRVGTVGGSYGGAFQFALQGAEVEKYGRSRLDAMVPIITWNDLAYSLGPNNSSPTFTYAKVPPGVPKYEWSELFFALGISEPAQHPTTTPVPPSTCPGFDPRVCVINAETAAHGYPTQDTVDILRHASPASFIKEITVPTMLIQGQTDTLFDMADAVANYRGITANGAPVKLVFEQGGHSGPSAPGEYNPADPSKGYLTSLIIDWFDHWLKGLPVSTGPAVEYFRDWISYPTDGSSSAAPAYASAPSWPVGTTATYYLSSDGSLVTSPNAVTPGTVSLVNPPGGQPASYSETSAFQSAGSAVLPPPTDPPGEFAAFSTRPLAADVDTVGIPTADVSVTAATQSTVDPAAELVLFGKIYDVAGDGKVTLVHRLVAPVRIKDLGRPVHINLPGVVHRYAAGHRIELVLASTDAAYTGSRIVNVISLHLDKRIPSRLTVPIVSAANQTPVSAPTVASASVRAGQVNGLGIQAAGAADVAPLPDTATAPAAPAALVAAALTWFGLAVRRRRSPASR